MSVTRAWRLKSGLTAIGIAAVLVVSACGSTSSTGLSVKKTTATFAELPGSQPNYIFPLASLQYFSVANLSQFQYLMYRPLYWFGNNGQVQLNTSLSLADPPVYSADGKSLTITLKGWKWSDGTQITARDIQFWENLVTANKRTGPVSPASIRTMSSARRSARATRCRSPSTSARRTARTFHIQRAEPDHAAPPARLGQGVGDRAVGNYDGLRQARRPSSSSSMGSRSPSRPTTPTRSGRLCRVHGS